MKKRKTEPTTIADLERELGRTPQDESFVKTFVPKALGRDEFQAFTAMKQAIAQRLGLRYGFIDRAELTSITFPDPKNPGEPMLGPDGNPVTMSSYPGLVKDVYIVLWLCSVPVSRALRAERLPDEATEEIYAWAQKKGLGYQTPRYYQALAIFLQIMAEVDGSTGEFEDAGEEGEETSKKS